MHAPCIAVNVYRAVVSGVTQKMRLVWSLPRRVGAPFWMKHPDDFCHKLVIDSITGCALVPRLNWFLLWRRDQCQHDSHHHHIQRESRCRSWQVSWCIEMHCDIWCSAICDAVGPSLGSRMLMVFWSTLLGKKMEWCHWWYRTWSWWRRSRQWRWCWWWCIVFRLLQRCCWPAAINPRQPPCV